MQGLRCPPWGASHLLRLRLRAPAYTAVPARTVYHRQPIIYSSVVKKDHLYPEKESLIWSKKFQADERHELLKERRHRFVAQTANVATVMSQLHGQAAQVRTGAAEWVEGEQLAPSEVAEGHEQDEPPAVFPFDLYQDRRPRHLLEASDHSAELLSAGEDWAELDPDSKQHQDQPPVRRGRGRGAGRGRDRRRRGASAPLHDHDFEIDILDERVDETEAKKLLSQDDMFLYGSADETVKTSRVPCGGCGAHLHCQDPKLPGFTPVEMFRGKSEAELRLIKCQRCYVMQEYNIALKMSVSPESYPATLSHLHQQKAIVLLLVDLLDFPGSVWPNIVDLLGPNKRIILVGNKVDLLPQDSKEYMKRVERSLKSTFLSKCNNGHLQYNPKVVSTVLVSARTGYNVEHLINTIYKSWGEKARVQGGDIYLVGTTNVGKSSLFNALLDSDLCKIKAIGNVEKAMTSPVPGTTLNLLKFPVMRPEPSRMDQRFTRLARTMEVFSKTEQHRLAKLRETRDRKYAMLSGPVEQTFLHRSDKYLPLTGVGFELETKMNADVKLPARLDPEDPHFADGKWLYDTPGTICEDQIINLLTQEEVVKMLPELPIRPRTFNMKTGQTLFLAGLARFDLLKGPFRFHPLLVTVFASEHLPITIVRTDDADKFYEDNLGSELLQVPSASGQGAQRLDEFPALKGEVFEIDGISVHEATCDIVLSSAGWITCAPEVMKFCTVKAWTPGGRGIFLRDPPFLPFAHKLRGGRVMGTPTYFNDKIFIPNSGGIEY